MDREKIYAPLIGDGAKEIKKIKDIIENEIIPGLDSMFINLKIEYDINFDTVYFKILHVGYDDVDINVSIELNYITGLESKYICRIIRDNICGAWCKRILKESEDKI